jgi:hypothetical protein
MGWRRQGLEFLHEFPNVSEVIVSDDGVEDLSALSGLKSLEKLMLECPQARIGPDFGTLPSLRDVRVDWRECYSSLVCNPMIEFLLLDRYSGTDLLDLKLPSLNTFRLLRAARMKSLDGISRMSELIHLDVYRCPKLQIIGDIAATPIQSLAMEACKSVADLDCVFGIKSLTSITIERCGDIASISGVSRLPLKRLRLVDVSIADGDVSELLALKNVDLFFTNKRHYSHRMLYVRQSGRFEILANE